MDIAAQLDANVTGMNSVSIGFTAQVSHSVIRFTSWQSARSLDVITGEWMVTMAEDAKPTATD